MQGSLSTTVDRSASPLPDVDPPARRSRVCTYSQSEREPRHPVLLAHTTHSINPTPPRRRPLPMAPLGAPRVVSAYEMVYPAAYRAWAAAVARGEGTAQAAPVARRAPAQPPIKHTPHVAPATVHPIPMLPTRKGTLTPQGELDDSALDRQRFQTMGPRMPRPHSRVAAASLRAVKTCETELAGRQGVKQPKQPFWKGELRTMAV